MRTVNWRKSSFSADTNGECVEVAPLDGSQVGVRDSKRPEAGHLALSRAGFAAWVGAVKAGEFDDLC